LAQGAARRPSTPPTAPALAGGRGQPGAMATLEAELAARRQANQELREAVAALRGERESVKQCCSVGIQAARAQMVRLRAELAAAQSISAHIRSTQSAGPQHEGSTQSGGPQHERSHSSTASGERLAAVGPADLDTQRATSQSMQLEVRCLKLELAKCRHRAERLEQARPQQEAELARLGADLTHLLDVLGSTRTAARHRELEAEEAAAPRPRPGGAPAANRKLKRSLSATDGGRGNVDAAAERVAREAVEMKGEELAEKVRKLQRVRGAQQMLIERLEKELLMEESRLQQKDMQIHGEEQRRQRLRGVLRQCSDDLVAAALGLGPAPAAAGGGQSDRGSVGSSREGSGTRGGPPPEEGGAADPLELPPIEGA